LPIFFDDENQVVEIRFGDGDICVGAHYGLRKRESRLTLTDIGQQCCIGQRLDEKMDEDAEDRHLTLTFPITPEGLNGMRVVMDRFLDALQGHYFNTIVSNLSHYVDKEDKNHTIKDDVGDNLNRCMFCYHTKDEVEKLVSVAGLFLCDRCIDAMHELAHSDQEVTLDSLVEAYNRRGESLRTLKSTAGDQAEKEVTLTVDLDQLMEKSDE